MDTPEAVSSVNWRVDKWFPELDGNALTLLRKYFDELLKANRTANLINVKTIPVADVLHFADCILGCRLVYEETKAQNIFDIGSGNGLPGIIFGILFPKTNVSLIESDLKRSHVLKDLISALGVRNITVINQSVEKLPAMSIDIAITRGFGSLTKTLLAARRTVKYPGVIYHMKPDNWGIELAEIPSQLCSSFEPSLLGEYRLPVGELKFAVIRTKKIKNE